MHASLIAIHEGKREGCCFDASPRAPTEAASFPPHSLYQQCSSGCRGRPLSAGWMFSRVLNRKTISLPASGIQTVNRKVNRQMGTSCAAINTRSSLEGAIPPSVFETTFSVLCSRTSKHIFVSLLQCHQHTSLFPVLFIAVHFSKNDPLLESGGRMTVANKRPRMTPSQRTLQKHRTREAVLHCLLLGTKADKEKLLIWPVKRRPEQ